MTTPTYALHEDGASSGMEVSAPDVDTAFAFVLSHYRKTDPVHRPFEFTLVADDGSKVHGQCITDHHGASYLVRVPHPETGE